MGISEKDHGKAPSTMLSLGQRASMAPSSPTVASARMRALLQEFASAVSEVNRMHSAQVAAVLNGDGLYFQDELNAAEVRRENAKYALMTHLREHGR
jgi:hypothetical protein